MPSYYTSLYSTDNYGALERPMGKVVVVASHDLGFAPWPCTGTPSTSGPPPAFITAVQASGCRSSGE